MQGAAIYINIAAPCTTEIHTENQHFTLRVKPRVQPRFLHRLLLLCFSCNPVIPKNKKSPKHFPFSVKISIFASVPRAERSNAAKPAQLPNRYRLPNFLLFKSYLPTDYKKTIVFLLKPWDNHILIQKIKEAYQNNRPTHHKNSPKSTQKASGDENLNKSEMLIGHSPAMLQLIKVVTKVAKTDANILITGENGTGKEMLAREIHRLSSRNTRQLLSVDMGAISESLFESELFGHERGAFTDAYESRPGKFEAANGGSLFMDEIGNLPLALQAKLLTVLQNRNITRIGSNKVIPVDIRLISATNKDIPEMIKEGLFREDLFYRINTIHLEIPPLRERGDDLLLFIDAFLHRFASKYQRPEMRMHEQTIEKLRSYHWPGNIRELQHTIEKAVILCESNVIRPKDILVKQTWKPQTVQAVPNLEEVERQAIETAILQNNGNLTAAAEQLGISRQTLYNKLKRFKP